MILAIFTSYPVPPRLKKISKLFGDTISYISWNRKDTPAILADEDYMVFDQPGIKGIKRYFGLFKFRRILKKSIKELNPTHIICRSWTSFLVTRSILCKSIIVYDVCDIPNNKYIFKLEHSLIRKRDKVILASRFFSDYYKQFDCAVFENRVNRFPHIEKKESNNLRVTYLGIIRYPDILKNLINATQTITNIELRIYGFGNDAGTISDYISTIGSKAKMMGPYNENDLPRIYSTTDVVWCAYPNLLHNVKAAISNKFFESIAYKTPGVFSINTRLGDLVERKKIGLIINPYDVKAIKELFMNLLDKHLLTDIQANLNSCDELCYWDEYKLPEEWK